MRHIRAIFLSILALTGTHMPAQDNAAQDMIPVLGNFRSVDQVLYLKDGGIESHRGKKVQADGSLKYTIDGRDYRMLSVSEVARLDAMPRVEVRQNALYFDGRRVKTNARRVYRIHSAHYWNGGVLMAARTSESGMGNPRAWLLMSGPTECELGFMDLVTGTCRFSVLAWFNTSARIPNFLVPVTLDTSRQDLALDVGMPGRVYRHEVFDLIVSVTNNSDGPVWVPEPLADGLGVALGTADGPPGRIKRPYGENVLPRPDAPGTAPRRLMPGERAETAVPTRPGVLSRGDDIGSSRTRVTFYWDALLDPDDGERMTRLSCERWLDVVASPEVDTSSRDLSLEVAAPGSVRMDAKRKVNDDWFIGIGGQHGLVHAGGDFRVRVALTNVSDRAIPVPDDLGDGLGVVLMYPTMLRLRDGTVHDPRWMQGKERERLLAAAAEVAYEPALYRRPAVPFPYAARCSPLAPGATREATVALDALRVFAAARRHLLTFVWDGLLDPDDRGRVSRFSTGEEVWVDFTW